MRVRGEKLLEAGVHHRRVLTWLEVAREMLFIIDLAARNASNVVGKPLEDFWNTRDKTSVISEWTLMKRLEMVEPEFNIPRNKVSFNTNIISPNTNPPIVQ